MAAVVSVMHTQLVPPRIKNNIPRTSLHPHGISIRDHRVTTVTAPAGYGKSVWIASLLEEPGWPVTAWLSLDRHDSETSFLLYHLIYSFRRVLPDFGVQSLRTMNSLEDITRDWEIAVSTLIEELPQEQEMVLVLDDFHLVEDNDTAGRVIEYMAQRLPEDLHLVIISREQLNLNLHRLKLSGELQEITSRQLLFSLTEAEELLGSIGLELGADEVAEIYSQAEGWAAGLRVIGMYLLESGGGIREGITAIKNRDTDLFNYLGSELLAYLPQGLNDFLLGSSMLPYLEPEFCNAALRLDDSGEKIRQLHANGILSRVEGETTTWRHHHLMREFLGKKAGTRLGPEEIVSIRGRAAVFLEARGDIDHAIEQAVAGADWENAIRLIIVYGERYFIQSGRQDALNYWICSLPGQQVADNQYLLYFKGLASLHLDPPEALETLSRSAELARTLGDTGSQVRALMSMLLLYNFTNDTKGIGETVSRIPAASSLIDDPWSRSALLVASLERAVSEDQLKRGAKISRMIGRTKLDDQLQLYYLLSNGLLNYRQGNMTSARQYIERALELPLVKNNDRWIGTAYEILSGIFCDTGELEKALELGERLIALGRKYSIAHQLAYGYRRRAQVYLKRGALFEARREHELSRGWWLEAGNPNMVDIIDLEIILIRSALGENPKTLFAEIREQLDQMTTQIDYVFRDFALGLAGVIAREAGELDLAQQWLEGSLASSAEKGAKHMSAGTLMHLARLHLLKGEERRADGCLRRALGFVEAAGLEVFWDWHPETIFSLCRRAVKKGIHMNWAARILARWFPQRLCKEACGLLASADLGFKAVIPDLIGGIVRETGDAVIHVIFLGGFRTFVNGLEVPASQWKTRKAESIFKYLIVNGNQALKDRIIEEMWPESGSHLGDSSLRMALTHIRKALGLEDDPTEGLILRRGVVSLNPRIKVFTDYELFVEVAQNALDSFDPDNPVSSGQIDRAAELYPGEFLPHDLYDDWTANRRSQLQNVYYQVVTRQVEYATRNNQLEKAMQSCRRYLEFDSANESMVRTLMEILWRTGKEQPALSVYRKLTRSLRKDYDMGPAVETQDLYEKIRRGSTEQR